MTNRPHPPTLLHRSLLTHCEPFTPPQTPDPWFSAPRPAFAFPISSKLKPQHPPPLTRTHSTLLHPSDPDLESGRFSSDYTAIALTTKAAVPLPAPKRPGPVQKSYTLLHPSSPQSSPLSANTEDVHSNDMSACQILTLPPLSDSSEFQSTLFKYSARAKPLFVFPHNLIPRSSSSYEYNQSRRRSVLHSSLSDTEE